MSCTVVSDDGSIYLQRRARLITEPAIIRAYEGRLTSAELVDLNKLLTNDDLQGVSDGSPSRMPQDSTDYAWVTAKIKRDTGVQEIDYRYWTRNTAVRNEDPKSDLEYSGVPQSYAERQASRLQLLQPLITWAHSIPIDKLKPTEIKPLICSR